MQLTAAVHSSLPKTVIVFKRFDQRVDGGASRVKVLQLLTIFRKRSGGREFFLREHSTDVPECLIINNRRTRIRLIHFAGVRLPPNRGTAD